MSRYNPAQRQAYADVICALAREWIVEREADFDVAIERGVERRANTATGENTPRANPTITLVLKINGGARATQGPPIMPSPPLFRDPTEQSGG